MLIETLEEMFNNLDGCAVELGKYFQGGKVYNTITVFKDRTFKHKCRILYPMDFSYACYSYIEDNSDLLDIGVLQSILFKIEDHLGKPIDELT